MGRCHFFCDVGGTQLVTFAGHFENLRKDFGAIWIESSWVFLLRSLISTNQLTVSFERNIHHIRLIKWLKCGHGILLALDIPLSSVVHPLSRWMAPLLVCSSCLKPESCNRPFGDGNFASRRNCLGQSPLADGSIPI